VKYLDIDHWSRSTLFHFFKDFTEPFFGVTVEVDVTAGYEKAKESGVSFFLYYLHCSLRAANNVESFKYRIREDKVVILDSVGASAVIGREDRSFGFSYIPYSDNLDEFILSANQEINRIQNSNVLFPSVNGDDVIHYSSVPWLRFTALSHARDHKKPNSCPKISFGKVELKDGRRTMPMSIHAHHALMDGWHVGQYVEKFERMMG